MSKTYLRTYLLYHNIINHEISRIFIWNMQNPRIFFLSQFLKEDITGLHNIMYTNVEISNHCTTH